MSTTKRTHPAWLPELQTEVQVAFKQSSIAEQSQRPTLEHELAEITDKIKGWTISLGNSNLPAIVREAIETQLTAACERKQAIEAMLADLDHADEQVDNLVDPEQILERLDRLADVLAENNPTRGNLELSLHIDRITCFKDRRVELRVCKLGTMPDAIRALSTTPDTRRNPENGSNQGKPRRRARLRVNGEDAGHDDLRSVSNFVSDTYRFAGLGEEWFWTREFRIPDREPSWVQKNAEAVFRRRQESKLPFSKLADEFGVTSPTIGAAIRAYLADHPEAEDRVKLARGGRRNPRIDVTVFAAEARQLFDAGWSKERLAAKFGCSPPVIDKSLAHAYGQDGLPPPTRANLMQAKVAEARRRHDQGQLLEEIAAAMKVSNASAHDYLCKSFEAEGLTMPDLRTVRHQPDRRRA